MVKYELAEWEYQLSAIRATGNGGQRVNKVATAIHLRFDINRSALPSVYKERLLKLSDSRITAEGIIIIKAQSFRTQDMNKADAIKRLLALINSVSFVAKKRRPTKPSKSSQRNRMDSKTKRGNTKVLRGSVKDY